jgi:hypothetical protein
VGGAALFCSAVGNVVVSAILTCVFGVGAVWAFVESRRPDPDG